MEPRVTASLVGYLYLILGVFLLAAPWSPLWSAATELASASPLGPWLTSGFTRGLVSGLGLLNLAAAASDAADAWMDERPPGSEGGGG